MCTKEVVHICKEDNPSVQEQISWYAGELYIDERMIRRALKKLPNKLAVGLDGILAILLKNCADTLCKPIHMLWQKSYEEGIVPKRLKYSLSLPQLKPGAKNLTPPVSPQLP